ncbi:MAG: hypothetical protein JWM81_819 [Candidatus Saccharibacteria bacterium]|nr:hypothetical protein [Candidatus Saccharibacteria bacterium]
MAQMLSLRYARHARAARHNTLRHKAPKLSLSSLWDFSVYARRYIGDGKGDTLNAR